MWKCGLASEKLKLKRTELPTSDATLNLLGCLVVLFVRQYLTLYLWLP